MYNNEINAVAAATQDSWSFGIHELVALVLFTACLTLGVIQLISFIKSIVNKEWDWDKKPVPAKISLIARGVLGWTIVIYIIGLLIFWNSWKWTVVYGVFVISLFSGCAVPFIMAVLFFFGHYFLYKPIKGIIAILKKK